MAKTSQKTNGFVGFGWKISSFELKNEHSNKKSKKSQKSV
jgi:hypothetical protein